MKIVLLEGLGVSDEIIENEASKLEKMGHTLTVYPKDIDVNVQKERLKDADVAILANMPLASDAVKEAKDLKFIDVAFTGVDHIPMNVAREKGIVLQR